MYMKLYDPVLELLSNYVKRFLFVTSPTSIFRAQKANLVNHPRAGRSLKSYPFYLLLC